MIKFLRNLLFHDFWLKLVSLALAVLIWFTVSFAIQKNESPLGTISLNNRERVFSNLPVLVMSGASEVKNFKINPSEVEVTVRGDFRILRTLQPKDIRVLVDLSGIEQAHDLHKKLDVSTPPYVTHVDVFPREVEVITPPRAP
jgi:YbbR domain-containing protein